MNQANGITMNYSSGKAPVEVGTRASGRRVSGTSISKTAVMVGLLPMMMLGGCDSLLEVTLPGQIAEDRLDDPAMAEIITRSVIGAYECALSEYALVSGMFGSELLPGTQLSSRDQFAARIPSAASTFGQSYGCVAASDPNPSGSGALYIAMGHGRDMTSRFENWTDADVPNRERHLAYTSTYTAYAMTALGEGFCEAVLEANGPVLSPPQVLGVAEEWFSKGLMHAESAGDPDVLSLALLGRARVRLNLGDLEGAIDDAERVPQGFVQYASRSATPLERQNKVWRETWGTGQMTVDPTFRNLQVEGIPDSRVLLADRGHATADGVLEAWYPVNKHDASDAGIRMASWEEAQLIIAEASLGQVAVDRINSLRQAHGLPLYVPMNVNDPDEILNQVIEERRRELFLEGRWLNDMIRHKDRSVIQWREGSTPQGVYEYRPLYCIPLPERELDNNPNL